MNIEKIFTAVQELLALEFISEAGLIALMATIIALLIPLSILLFNPQEDVFPLDKSIIFKKIFLYNNFTVLIIPVAITLLFPQLRLLSTIAVIYLSILAMRIFFKIFKWLSADNCLCKAESFRQKMRLDYLNELRSESEILNAWSTILNGKFEEVNQHGLLSVYIDSSRYICKKDDNWNNEIYWGLLKNNFSKIINIDDKSYNKLVNKALSYYIELGEWLKKDKEKKKIHDRPPESLRQISQIIMREALTSPENSIKSYVYFDIVEKYIKSQPDWRVLGFLETYIDDLLDCFIHNEINIYDKWTGSFFERITVDNTATDCPEKQLLIEEYYKKILISYVRQHENPSNEIGDRISRITERLFTEINPITWFQIITFIMWPYEYSKNEDEDAKNRIKNWSNRSRNYGLSGRLDCSIMSISEPNVIKRRELMNAQWRKEIQKQDDATYKMLVKIFCFGNWDFTRYKKVISDLKKNPSNSERLNDDLKILDSKLNQLRKHVICK